MDRALQSSTATASAQYTTDGANADPGVVTVGITREDGTTLVAPGTATAGASTAPRTFALTTAHTATLDLLTVTWTSATLGVMTTYVEIVGGFLFTVADARAIAPLSNATLYPNANIIAARTVAEAALEDACGVAFVPRYCRELIDGPAGGGNEVLLDRPRPLSITAASDTSIPVADPTTLVLYRDGRVYNPTRWAEGRRTVSLKYTHGYRFPPPRVGRACALLAKRFLVDSPISDRATVLQSEDGTTQFFVTAGVRDAVFDVPECNAVVAEYGVRFGIG